jgi:hypothetical protein
LLSGAGVVSSLDDFLKFTYRQMRVLSLRVQNANQKEMEFKIEIANGKRLDPHERVKCIYDAYLDTL